MSWHGIEGHDEVVDRFRRALTRGRLASSFLFVGPAGIGKRSFALKFAQGLLCQTRPEEALDPCGRCAACTQVSAGTHPDLELVAKPENKSFIPLELLIGDEAHRMREGLCHNMALRPFMGGRKIALIDDADYLNKEGANCLLKTLEEPPPRSVLILIGTSPARQLPTIRSRCQLIRFHPLSAEVLAGLLISQEAAAGMDEARRLAECSRGSLRRALELADEQLWAFRHDFLPQLTGPRPESVRLAEAVTKFVDEAGREAAARRQRLREVIELAIESYRHLLRERNAAADATHTAPEGSIAQALRQWPGDGPTAAACLDRCLEATKQIDRNANLATLIECWLDDLARIVMAG